MSQKILIVEDAPELANILVKTLREEGFEPVAVHDGTTALRRMQDSWDLIILDLMLPDVGGETLLNHVTQQTTPPPVLVLTARNRLEDTR